MTDQPSNYAADVECAIGLNVGGDGTEGVYAARDAVLAVRDREMEQVRADLDRVQQAACRTAEILRNAMARAEQAEDAIERVRQLCELTIGTSVRVQAVQQAYDTLAAFDEPQQPAT